MRAAATTHRFGNVVNLERTTKEVLEWTTTHETGHHLHFSATFGVNEVIEAAYKDPERDYVGEYGASNHEEYFAESYCAYHHLGPEWREKRPRATAMVEAVMRMRGLL